MGSFGGEVDQFGGEASTAPPPPLDETLISSEVLAIYMLYLQLVAIFNN